MQEKLTHYFTLAGLILGIILFLGASNVHAAGILATQYDSNACTILVSTSGSDNNLGSITAPLRTIQKATAMVKAGDIVCVRAGTYPGFSFNAYVPGTAAARIVFRPYPGEHVIIDKALMDPDLHTIVINAGASYLTIEGFEITDSRTSPPSDDCNAVHGPSSPVSRNAIKLYGRVLTDPSTFPDHIILQNLHIHHSRGTAIQNQLRDSQIINNEINDNGLYFEYGWTRYQAYGTYVEGDRIEIKNNVIYRNSGNGIRAANPESPDLTINDSIVEGNLIYQNGGLLCHNSVVKGGGYGIVLWGGSGNHVRNNIVLDQGKGTTMEAIGLKTHIAWCATCRKDPNFIYNNTVVGSYSIGIANTDGELNVYRNNIAFANGVDFYIGGGVQDHNLIGIDPLFLDRAARDMHLTANSPAINAGTTLSEVTTDFEGTIRPQGSAYDIGADEYGSGSTPSPTPTPTASVSPAPCQNPTPIPSGFAAPCPVFGVSPASGSASQNFTVSVKPDPSKTVWTFKTLYLTEGSTWKSITLPGTVQYTYWLQGNVTFNFQPSTLNLTPGTHYLASWDWTWDAANQCYKGPGATACGGGQYRIQSISVR